MRLWDLHQSGLSFVAESVFDKVYRPPHAFCLYVGQREQGEVSQYLLETEKQSQREIDQFILYTP